MKAKPGKAKRIFSRFKKITNHMCRRRTNFDRINFFREFDDHQPSRSNLVFISQNHCNLCLEVTKFI